ncbi:MAG: ATP-binding cassette domain-containing protein [Proteobacteria bacterium]|nr:ATP-binding cassette domain-containing protein [Pseudomonadota bacterium]
MTAIELSHVSVTYDSIDVVRDVSFVVATGEWVSVVGPNGAGKSSLLKTMVGAVGYSGSVELRGEPATELRGRRRASIVAYVPQRSFFPPGMTVFDFVLLGRTPHMGPLASESRGDIDAVWEALEALHIEGFASRDVATLSGGEAQRASLARVIAQRSPILVLDEATASLDLSAQHEVLELIDGLRTSHEITVISAIHDLTAAAQFCDSVALLAGGDLVGFGSPAEVLTEPVLRQILEPSIRVIQIDGNPVIVSLRTQESHS